MRDLFNVDSFIDVVDFKKFQPHLKVLSQEDSFSVRTTISANYYNSHVRCIIN